MNLDFSFWLTPDRLPVVFIIAVVIYWNLNPISNKRRRKRRRSSKT